MDQSLPPGFKIIDDGGPPPGFTIIEDDPLPQGFKLVNDEPSRSFGEVASDFGTAAEQGLVGLGQTAVGTARTGLSVMDRGLGSISRATGLPNPMDLNTAALDWAEQKLGGYSEGLKKDLSPAMAQKAKNLEKTSGVIPSIKAIVSDPELLAHKSVESLPAMATIMLTARRAAASEFEKLGATVAKETAEKAAEAAALKATIGSNAMLSGGGTVSDIREAISKTSDENLQKNSPMYKQLRDRGVSEAEARKELMYIAGAAGGGVSAILSAIATRIFGGGAEAEIAKKLAGVGGQQAGKSAVMEGAKTVAKTGFKESGEETIQSGGEQFGQNVGKAAANRNQDLLERVPESMAIGGTLGVVLGVAGGGASSVMPTKGGGVSQEISTNLDVLDQAKKEKELTQGQGTFYVGKQGDVTNELPRKIEESSGERDLIQTELQNRLQQEATRNEGQSQGNLFPEDYAKAQLRQAQALNLLADQAEAAGKTDMATQLRQEAEIAILSAKSYNRENQGNLDLRTEPKLAQESLWPAVTKDSVEGAAPANASLDDHSVSDTAMEGMVRPFKASDFTTTGAAKVSPDGKRVFVTPEAILRRIKSDYAMKPHEELGPILNVVERLLNGFQKDGKSNHGLWVELSDKDTVKAPGSKPGDRAAGYYWAHDNSLVLGKKGQTDRGFIHEILHAMTERYMEAYPNDPDVKALKSLLDQIRAKGPSGKFLYGTKDHSEMISEAYSSNIFKRELMGINVKVGGKVVNAYKALTQAIAKVLKIEKPEEQNAFTRIMELSERIAEKHAKDYEATATQYKKLEAEGKLPAQLAAKLDQVTDGAVSRAKAVESPPKFVDEHTAKQEVISKVAGMDYIPADPKVTPELINEIVGDPDSNPYIKLPKGKKIGTGSWIPGAAAFAQLHKSKLALVVYRFANNAVKRSELFGREVVQPVEKTISKLLKNDKDASLLKDILMRELARKEDYTPDELRAAGVPDKIIMAQAEFRAMMQQALEKQNAVIRAKNEAARAKGLEGNLKEIKGIDAYYSARWSGPWRANVRDADGKIVWQIAEKSKSLADNAVKYLQARQPGLTYEPVTYKKGRERGDSIEAGYLDMLNLLDKDDPRIQTLKGIYEEYLEGKTDNISNQEKHQLRKTGVRGFAGDRPWSKTDVKDFFVQQFEYAKNAARWAEFQQAAEGVGKLLNNPDIKQSQPNTVKWSQDYMKNQLGFGTSDLFNQIDNSLAKALGTSPQKMQEYMGAAKTFFYLKVLGLNIPFTISQFLQPAISTPAQHALLSSQGFKHNPIMSLIGAMQGGSAAAAWHYSNGFNNKAGAAAAEKLMSPLQLEAAKYMEANQVVDINPMSDIKRNLRPTAVKVAAAPFEFFIRHSEVIARSWAFQSFVSHLEQSGVYDTKTKAGRLELFQKAEEMTQLSMTDYRASERAQIFEKGGLTGDAASTLHSFQINYLMQLSTYTKEASKGNVLPLFYFMAIQAAAGGMLGMWFIEDLDDLLDNIKKLMPHDQYKKVKDFNLKNWILDNFGELASFGLASKVSGTNIHTRMNASDQIPIWPFESGAPLDQAMGLVPFSKEIWESGKAGVTMLTPSATPQDRAQAMYQLTPSGFKGALENQPPFTEGGVSASPRDLSMGQYRRTPEESNLRTLGLRSPEETKFMEKKYALSKVERELMDRVQTASKKSTQFFTSGKAKEGVEELIKYTDLGGDPMTIINGIPQAQINRVTTEVERRALAAGSGSRPSVLKLQRALQFYNSK